MQSDSNYPSFQALEQESNKNFDSIVRESLDRSKYARMQALILRKAINFDKPLDDVALIKRYILMAAEAKYGPSPDVMNLHWIDPEELYRAIDQIEKDERVHFVAKDNIWMLCDLYAGLRGLSIMVNALFPGRVKRKMSNTLYKSFMELLSKIIYRLPYRNDRKQIVLNRNTEIRKLLLLIISEPFSPISQKEQIADSVDFVENLLSGDIRKIQKKLFPLFYQMIVLNNDEKTNGFGSASMVKTCLFFEIFRVLVPEKQFLSKEQFESKFQSGRIEYNGSYSRYQHDLIRSLIGK